MRQRPSPGSRKGDGATPAPALIVRSHAARLAGLVVLALSGAPAGAQSPPDPAQNRGEAARQLETSRDTLRQTERRAQSLQSDVAQLNAEQARINAELIETGRLAQQSEARLSQIEARVGELDAQEKLLRGSLAARHDRIAKLFSAMQRMGRNPPPVIITQREDALRMVRSAMLLARAFPELKTQADELSGRLRELVRVMTDARAEGERLRSEAARLSDARTRLATLVETKRKSLSERQRELEDVRRSAADIARSVTDLSELIGRLDKAVAQRTALAEYERELQERAEREAREAREAQAREALAAQAAAASAPPPPVAPPPPAAQPATPVRPVEVGAAPPAAPVPPAQTLPGRPTIIETPAGAAGPAAGASAGPASEPQRKEASTPAGSTPAGSSTAGSSQVAALTGARPQPPRTTLEPQGALAINPGRMKPALPFHQAKGMLPMPAQGKRILGFNEKNQFGRLSRGIIIETRHGATVVSPSDGWVVYAGEFRSYGQVLIINAGGGYHILLANLARTDVEVGRFVLAGEPVGAMSSNVVGKAQDTAAPVLYVEFRNKEGQSIDPTPWWADGSQKVQG